MDGNDEVSGWVKKTQKKERNGFKGENALN